MENLKTVKEKVTAFSFFLMAPAIWAIGVTTDEKVMESSGITREKNIMRENGAGTKSKDKEC